MHNNNNNKRDLAIYRLDMAENCLKTANGCFDSNDYKGSANRSYSAKIYINKVIKE